MDTQDLTGYRYIGSASKNQGSIGLYWMLYSVLYQRMVVALRPWVDPMSYRISSRAVADWTRRRVAQNRAWLSFVRKRNQRRGRLAGDRRVCRSAKAAAIKTCCVGVWYKIYHITLASIYWSSVFGYVILTFPLGTAFSVVCRETCVVCKHQVLRFNRGGGNMGHWGVCLVCLGYFPFCLVILYTKCRSHAVITLF